MDTYYTLKPINFILKCFALNCVFKKDNNIVSSWSLLKNLIIMFILFPINLFIFCNFNLSDIFTFVFVLQLVKYIVDLVHVQKYGTKKCVRYYYTYDKIDEILKIYNYNKIKATCLKITASACACLTFTNIFDYAGWHLLADTVISHPIEYFYSFATMLTILDMVCHVVQIE